MFCCALYIQKSREGKEINVAYLVTRPSKLIFQVTSITRVFWRVLFWLTRTSWRAISFWLSDMSKTQPSAGSAVSVSGANRGIHTAVFLNLHHRKACGWFQQVLRQWSQSIPCHWRVQPLRIDLPHEIVKGILATPTKNYPPHQEEGVNSRPYQRTLGD